MADLTAARLDVDGLLSDPAIRIVVCCGAGGVGKTTTAAALGLRAAEVHGRRTVVLTIDPARRLAQSMGLTELDNTPRQVKGIDTAAGGELHAMMLDMKRTFDEVVEQHTKPDRAAEIFANPFYQAMSSTFAGTQEYMAMEKLGQLRAADEWDLIVVDTPPSRSALDFLDAPARLSRFLDGRMLRMLLAPARAGGKSMFSLVTASFGLFSRAVQKILGAQLLTDLSGFVAALDSMFGGFRARADQTYRVLQDPQTAFLLVAAPERDAVREAAYFAERLVAERMPLGGLVLNRMHQAEPAGLTAEQSEAAAAELEAAGDQSITADVLRIHAGLLRQTEREVRVAATFIDAFPHVPTTVVAAQPADVHDVDGLRTIGTLLA
ncbi:anion-transporting ArsA/GET3 family ATPase [Actinoplanes lutulentus]|uniref:Arsenite efflux ATP-binding protein ArsA n=1 Tax=Actinoplanes lutulentus TaxID=1287878 RepID=A0A327Z878_9ACTN|nr:anion-transporting ArsA/GET3 family ATPase [Actinoplanes lutulentus]RAK27262.1 arsenite efflux ATP-binding protein ArsA [Actinoplanes lutulentus]